MVAVTYNPLLVGISLVVAIMASYTALELARRVATSGHTAGRIWLACGAFSMGIGIWTAHFIGMIAVETGLPQRYDPMITVLSLAVGIAASAFAIFAASKPSRRPRNLLAGGIVLGFGIAGMHYTGMAAVRMPARVLWSYPAVAISVAIAVVAAIAALWISAKLASSRGGGPLRFKIAAAFVMGIAICGMHYTGIAAASFAPDPSIAIDLEAYLPGGLMAGGLSLASLLILTATHLTLFFDYRLGTEARIGDQLRQLVAERTHEIEAQAADLRESKARLEQQVESNRHLSTIVEQALDSICVTRVDRKIEYVNACFEREFGYTLEELRGKTAHEMNWARSLPEVYDEMHNTAIQGQAWSGHLRSASRDGTVIDHDVVVSPIVNVQNEVTHYVQIRRDVTEKLRLEQQLRQSQKLESIGQLAAGIAHEINTPAQFVGDNTRFLKDAFDEFAHVIRSLMQVSEPTAREAIAKVLDDADLDFLLTETPQAIEQSLEGVSRIARIVGAMKEFSHPAQEMTPIDLNRAIESTVTIATNEWRYVAEVELDLDSTMPPVPCMPADFNQVVLNIIINGAHAIAEAINDSDERGRISVTTRHMDGWAEIRIADSGCGIPDSIKEKIFDPFFTTKEVGKGTGQGLNMAHRVIVDRHGGTLNVESEPGAGACFVIRLPIEQWATNRPVAAA